MHTSSPTNLSEGSSRGVVQSLRQHPILFYFLLAFGFTWAYEIPVLLLWHLPLLPQGIPLPFVGPTLSAFLLTAVTSGKKGVGELLRRYVRGRVGLQWYLAALAGIPTLFLLSSFLVPGAAARFHAPSPSFALTYLGTFITIFLVGGPLGEEPGWRGFALPHLQQRMGPLPGAVILGVLWALWHLPLYFLPGYNGSGTGLAGILLPFALFTVTATALSVIMAWVFNHTRGSLLVSMLLHASNNTAAGLFTTVLFVPSLDLVSFEMKGLAVMVVAALLISVFTRGRLGYKRLGHEVLPVPQGENVEQKVSV